MALTSEALIRKMLDLFGARKTSLLTGVTKSSTPAAPTSTAIGTTTLPGKKGDDATAPTTIACAQIHHHAKGLLRTTTTTTTTTGFSFGKSTPGFTTATAPPPTTTEEAIVAVPGKQLHLVVPDHDRVTDVLSGVDVEPRGVNVDTPANCSMQFPFRSVHLTCWGVDHKEQDAPMGLTVRPLHFVIQVRLRCCGVWRTPWRWCLHAAMCGWRPPWPPPAVEQLDLIYYTFTVYFESKLRTILRAGLCSFWFTAASALLPFIVGAATGYKALFTNDTCCVVLTAFALDLGTCATVEKMGEEAAGQGSPEQASLRVRELIRCHFELHGAARVRTLPGYEFCRQGSVLGKSSEAGFGNEMYKILTTAALSIMLNRSLIIGQTRGSYPFEEYISYTNHSFTVQEIKHLWKKHRCARTYGKDLNMRVGNFENPSETKVLCSDWKSWKDPIIWFDGATDAIGAQFFPKDVHPGMKAAASTLFGLPDSIDARPNTFGDSCEQLYHPPVQCKQQFSGL